MPLGSGLTRLRHDDVCLLIRDPVMDEISPMVIRWELVAVASVTMLKHEQSGVTRWRYDDVRLLGVVSPVCVMTMCTSWEWCHSVVS